MLERFSLRSLRRGVSDGLRLRQRDPSKQEVEDFPTRLVLASGPILAAALVARFDVLLPFDQLIGATALFSGALLVGFSQVAAWRERLLQRQRQVDAVDVRALTEAAAHILFSILVSLVAVTALAVVAYTAALPASQETWLTLLASRGANGVAAGALVQIGLTLVIVVNLLWDALQKEERDAQKRSLGDHSRE